ncbi:uncharacterized protein FIBRA_09484 [Fibroporia radiculosa]|uniref:Uncharacterized protein n=1 Tax=Fibroporia radiculosa TaxID=599839 RepID=J7SCG7_9APHY|nr:uncharacterized protein FIBRA_09484 [Fibroporia radiculosa]CCM07146.1 predicted protein [Fibroporia radiculosa]
MSTVPPPSFHCCTAVSPCGIAPLCHVNPADPLTLPALIRVKVGSEGKEDGITILH